MFKRKKLKSTFQSILTEKRLQYSSLSKLKDKSLNKMLYIM